MIYNTCVFTGIVTEIGTLKSKHRPLGADFVRLAVASKKIRPAAGESVCVNGVCVTVTKRSARGFEADVIPETLALTNLGNLKIGSALNLETSLKMGEAISGHFVSGHVDAAVSVLTVGRIRHGKGLILKLPKKFATLVAKKGSVALNGVSLTVAEVKKNSFTVALTPFTLRHTNLGALRKGDLVNLECDMVARYLEKLYENRHHRLKI